MDPKIDEFIQCKRIAVEGVSRSEKKFGAPCYPNLAAIQGGFVWLIGKL
jgi:hypothetical protein